MSNLIGIYARLVRVPGDGWWALPLRLIVGFGFMEHGYAKLARGADSFIGILEALHMPAAPFLAWATILTELIGGFCVLVGAFLPLASLPMAAVLIVAIVTVHLPNGFSSIKLEAITPQGPHFGQPGYETDLLYLAALAALVLGGASPFSIDALFLRRQRSAAENRESGNPGPRIPRRLPWMPAFAGMTEKISAAQALDPSAGEHHQDLLEAGRNRELGMDLAKDLDLRKPLLIGDDEPSLTDELRRRRPVRRRADLLQQ